MVAVKGMVAGVSLMHGGFNGPRKAAEEAMNQQPDFMAADAGSTDAGPAFLGGETGMTHRGGIKASLEYIIPLAVGEEDSLYHWVRRSWGQSRWCSLLS